MDPVCNKRNHPWEFNINELPATDDTTLLASKPFPKCKHCGDMARPNVSFFEDYNFNEMITKNQSKRFLDWIEHNKNSKLLIMEMGCGLSVHSIRFKLKNNQYTMLSNEWKLPKSLMTQHQTNMVRINPECYEIDTYCLNIPLGAKQALKML